MSKIHLQFTCQTSQPNFPSPPKSHFQRYLITSVINRPLDFPLPRPFSLRSSSSSTRGGGSATSQGSKLRWRRQAHRATASSGPSKVIALVEKWWREVLVQMWTVCILCLTNNKLILFWTWAVGMGESSWEHHNQMCSPAYWLRSCSQCCWLPKNHLSAEDDTSFGDVQKKTAAVFFE